MRVNIAYAVDIEEVPKRVLNLIRDDVEDQMKNIDPILKRVIFNLEEYDNHIQALEEIDKLRKLLYKIDQRLDDCSTILSEFQEACVRQLEGVWKQVAPAGDSPEEEEKKDA